MSRFKRRMSRKNKPHYHKSRYSRYTGFESLLFGRMMKPEEVNPYKRREDEKLNR